MSNADYFLIALSIVLTFISIRLLIKANMLNKANAKLAASIPQQTPFDPLVSAGKGMEVINDFLKINFLKFVNSQLITLNEKSETPVNEFLIALNNDEKMSKLSTGFLIYINTMMSENMKILFNRYYKVLDETGKTTPVYTQYITEWFILGIREIQAELSAANSQQEDYSIRTNIMHNANIFADIELSLYKELKIISDTNSNETKK
jgi:hypothetical protein